MAREFTDIEKDELDKRGIMLRLEELESNIEESKALVESIKEAVQNDEEMAEEQRKADEIEHSEEAK